MFRDRPSRRAVLSSAALALPALAGCSSVLAPSRPTGTLAVRVRNFDSQPREVSVAVFLDSASEPADRWSADLPGHDGAAVPEELWRIEDVRDETPYRLVATVDGERHERKDLANCIADGGEVRGVEYADVTIQDGDGGPQVTLLSDDCSAE